MTDPSPALHVDGLVGGEDHHAPLAEFLFQFQRVEVVAAGPFDVLAYDGGKWRVIGCGGGAEVGHAAVPRDAGVGELLPHIEAAAGVQVGPAAFHVPVVAGDVETLGQPFVGPADLPAQGFRRVLHGAGGGPPHERQGYRPGGGCPRRGFPMTGIAVLSYPLQKLLDCLGLPRVQHGGFPACLHPYFKPDFHPAGPLVLIQIIADNAGPDSHSG